MLTLFHRYYSPRQQLGCDEGMIPTKNRLVIKQYIRDKPVRWGIKSFLLCEVKMGYILNAEVYTGRVKDRHWPLRGLAGSVGPHLAENLQVTNKNHMLFMDCFYNTIKLFHLLKNELAVGTIMPSCKHYPKELGKRLTERGRYEFWCRGGLCAIAWKDRKPIHFLSNYHYPRRASTVNRPCGRPAHTVDRATACGSLHQVSEIPASFHTILHECSASGYSNFASCCRYMETVDTNDQIARLNKMRCHYGRAGSS